LSRRGRKGRALRDQKNVFLGLNGRKETERGESVVAGGADAKRKKHSFRTGGEQKLRPGSCENF